MCTPSPILLPSQRALLLAFHRDARGREWECKWDTSDNKNDAKDDSGVGGVSSSATSTESANAWPGVTLDSEGRVQRLELRDSLLSGTISGAALGGLACLTVLDLSWNSKLDGLIPQELGQCRQLRVLNLAGCYRLGRGETFPPFLVRGCCPRLETLNLHRLTGLTGAISGEFFERCPELKYLNLGGCRRLSGALPDSIGLLTRLETLDLSDCTLEGPVPDSITRCASLRRLVLRNCRGLTGELPAGLGALANLEQLDLAGCGRFGGGIPPSLGQCAKLKELDLNGCAGLSGPVPADLGALGALRVLRLRWCPGLSGALPGGIGHRTGLAVERTALGEPGGEDVPERRVRPTLRRKPKGPIARKRAADEAAAAAAAAEEARSTVPCSPTRIGRCGNLATRIEDM